MNPYLSIIVPVYKVEDYLNKCIDSILSQTFQDFELILVNDGSPDNCPIICEEYATLDKRVKVIHKKNGGLVSARKAGLRIATGKYVGYVDSDDWIELDMYEEMCKTSKQYDADIVICDVIFNYPNKETKIKQKIKPGLYDKSALKEQIYPRMLYFSGFYNFGLHPAVWNKIYKKEILENNQYKINESISMGEDAACSFPCLLDAKSIYILDSRYLYHYRQRSSSMTRSYDDRLIENVNILYTFLKDTNKDKANIYDLTNQLYYYYTKLILGMVDNEFSINNKKKISDKWHAIKELYGNENINEAIKEISLIGIPFKFRIYIYLLKKNSVFRLNILSMTMEKLRGINSFLKWGL